MKKEKKSPGAVHALPQDLRKSLNFSAPSKAAWKEISPLARNEWICWVTSAKKPETREKRTLRTTKDLAAGKRRPCCWPGCPHRNPESKKGFK